VPFPDDRRPWTRKVALPLGMVHERTSGHGTCAACFFIEPKSVVRASSIHHELRRNMDEILRVCGRAARPPTRKGVATPPTASRARMHHAPPPTQQDAAKKKRCGVTKSLKGHGLVLSKQAR